jgi:hypothetical protein
MGTGTLSTLISGGGGSYISFSVSGAARLGKDLSLSS